MDAMCKPVLLFLLPAALLAQAPALTGKWYTSVDFYGTPLNYDMELMGRFKSATVVDTFGPFFS